MEEQVEVEGDWDALLALGMRSALNGVSLPLATRLRFGLQRLRARDTRRRARSNIARHYDLGDEFYRLWLDEGLTYSCATFRSPEDSLEEAQAAKLDLICRKLRLEPGQRLLDVGCGWGSLIVHAARHYGVHAVGCTLSRNQAALAEERIRKAGLEDRVQVRLCDYRELSGRFDRWVSVGMLEHVGRAFLPRFARNIRRRLRPGGLGLLHFIGKDRAGPGDPWTLTYIFPGAYLPSLPEVLGAMGRFGLCTLDVENLRAHYPLTLDRWRERFERQVREIRHAYGERFVRMWRLYLVASAASFRYGECRVFQVLFGHGSEAALPLAREHRFA